MRSSGAFGLVMLALVLGAALTFLPMLTPVVLAAWSAKLLRPVFERFARRLRGRRRAAGALTAALVLVVATPLVLSVFALVPAIRELLEQVRRASGGRGMLAALVSGSGAAPPPSLVDLVRDYGANASRVASVVAGASASAIVAVFVFFAVFFSMLVDGPRLFAWMRDNAPLDPEIVHRLAAAFHEAGRGLLVGNGLTALLQGGLATVAYVALGVPRALLLGLLSVVGALVPMVGTAIVWVPVAAGLLLTGHPLRAAGLLGFGVAVIGTVDNVVRPWLSGRARVGIPSAVVLVAILGGIAAFGPWGLLLGPLVVRLAAEGLVILRERSSAEVGSASPPRA